MNLGPNAHIYARHVLQGRTAQPVACLAMDAAVAQMYAELQAAGWREVTDQAATLPRHNWAQSGHKDNFDAYRFCGDYADGYQHGYAGAVDYVVQIPADARTGAACTISALTVTAHGDRYLGDGAILAAIPSTSPLPPTWAEVLVAAYTTSHVTPILKVATVSNTGTDTTATATVTCDPAINAQAYVYLHLVLRLVNYESHRGAWIEGGAMLDGATLTVTYSRTVTADDTTDCPVYAAGRATVQPDGTILTPAGYDQAWRVGGMTDTADPDDATLRAALWSSAIGSFPSTAMEAIEPATRGGDQPLGAFLTMDNSRQVWAHAAARFFPIGQTDGRSMGALTFDRAIPTPATYTRARLAVYALTGLTGASSTLGAIDAATFATSAFWGGTATGVSVGGASYTATALLRLTITSAIAAGTSFPVTWQSDAPAMLLLVMGLCRMCASPGWTLGTRYGLIFAPDVLTLTE